jgi:hypothetical protein
MKKMEGVEAVEARLNEGKAIVKLKAGNTIQFEQVIKVIRDKAFTPKEARVSVRGEVVSTGTKLQLKVSGTNDVYDLGGAIAEIKNNIGKTLLVEGVIPAPKEKTYQKVIEVKSARL